MDHFNLQQELREKMAIKQQVPYEPIACVQPGKIALQLNCAKHPMIEKKRRTVTSYDSQTSNYLKSVFFEIYSCQNKLTKQQRTEVQKQTGLPSRNITYWFSNHKRRFRDTLKVYRKAVHVSNGTIKNYRDFIQYRQRHGLPEQITQEELNEFQKNSVT